MIVACGFDWMCDCSGRLAVADFFMQFGALRAWAGCGHRRYEDLTYRGEKCVQIAGYLMPCEQIGWRLMMQIDRTARVPFRSQGMMETVVGCFMTPELAAIMRGSDADGHEGLSEDPEDAAEDPDDAADMEEEFL